MKHCDLPAILARVDSLQGGNGNLLTIAYDDVDDLIKEVRALRNGLDEAIALLDAHGAAKTDIRHLCTLLPPTKEPTDAR